MSTLLSQVLPLLPPVFAVHLAPANSSSTLYVTGPDDIVPVAGTWASCWTSMASSGLEAVAASTPARVALHGPWTCATGPACARAEPTRSGRAATAPTTATSAATPRPTPGPGPGSGR